MQECLLKRSPDRSEGIQLASESLGCTCRKQLSMTSCSLSSLHTVKNLTDLLRREEVASGLRSRMRASNACRQTNRTSLMIITRRARLRPLRRWTLSRRRCTRRSRPLHTGTNWQLLLVRQRLHLGFLDLCIVCKDTCIFCRAAVEAVDTAERFMLTQRWQPLQVQWLKTTRSEEANSGSNRCTTTDALKAVETATLGNHKSG
jgi:hypothetical protein